MTDINVLIKYNEWFANATDDLKRDLQEISDNHAEMTERFYQDLKFGTAGLRGKMEAGTNRMNIYTVGRAAAGLAETLEKKSVVIAYDNRLNSLLFAKTAAKILRDYGVEVYLFSEIAPTPMLSYAVRYLKCGAGIMITASHNGYKYNGFKCYGADGCQMTDVAAGKVWDAMSGIEYFSLPITDEEEILAFDDYKIVGEDVWEFYYNAVLAQRLNPYVFNLSDLKILYTPLNGTGAKVVENIFKRCGVENLAWVEEQRVADGYFTTCPEPNPEEKSAFDLALKYAETVKPDLILATDPDADRLGVMVAFGGEYKIIDGNEIGCLLLDYILENKVAKGTLSHNPVAIKTVTTAPMTEKIAAKYGCEIENLLVGFKYICERVENLKSCGRDNDFVFGFEESNGYLCGNYTGDKDGILAAMLVAEMAAFYKSKKMTLINRLRHLYYKHGSYQLEICNLSFEGKSGAEKMKKLMTAFRENPFTELAGKNVIQIDDYLKREKRNLRTGVLSEITLPPTNMLEFKFADGCSLIMRPSGTEPKLKLYYNAVAETFTQGKASIAKMKEAMTSIIEELS